MLCIYSGVFLWQHFECYASTSFPVASAPTNLMAVQEGPTAIQVSWTPPTPLGDTTGYRIYYSGGSSGSVDVSGGSTDSIQLTGLQSGASYTISIAGTSQHLPSDRVNYTNSILLGKLVSVFGKPPCLHCTLTASEMPNVMMSSTTTISISLLWNSDAPAMHIYIICALGATSTQRM